jgi:hypothetical protein
METKSSMGIWMDHSTAHVIDLASPQKSQSIHSAFNFQLKEEALSRSENIMHNKEQQMHEAYYKELGAEVQKYDHVLLFGPTNAKVELFNYLQKDAHFKEIKIDVEAADKMTENEQIAFVKDHFEKA